AKAVRTPISSAKANHENPVSWGGGVCVPRLYISRPSGERKGQNPASPENHSEAVEPPRRFVPPTPPEKARPVDLLRAALAGSAPASHAAARRGEGGARP